MGYYTYRNKKIKLVTDQNGHGLTEPIPYTGELTHLVVVDDGTAGTGAGTSGEIELLPSKKAPQLVRVIGDGGGPFFITFHAQKGDFTISGANWDDGTVTITSTGSFADYTYEAGDVFQATAGTPTGGSLNEFDIAINGNPDDDTITLAADLVTGDNDIDNSTLAGKIKKTVPAYPTTSTAQVGFALRPNQEHIFALGPQDTYFSAVGEDTTDIEVYVTPIGDCEGTLG